MGIDFLKVLTSKFHFYLFILICLSCKGQNNDRKNFNNEFFCYEFDSFVSQLNLKNLKDKNEEGELGFRIWALNAYTDTSIFIADVKLKGNRCFLKRMFIHISDTSFVRNPLLNHNFIIDSTQESELSNEQYHSIKKEINLVMNHSLFAMDSLPLIAGIIGFYFEFSEEKFYNRLQYKPCSDFKFGLPIQPLVNQLFLSLAISKEIDNLQLWRVPNDCIPIEAEGIEF